MVVDCGGGRWLWVVVVGGSSLYRLVVVELCKEVTDDQGKAFLFPFIELHHQEISLLEGELKPPLWHDYLWKIKLI